MGNDGHTLAFLNKEGVNWTRPSEADGSVFGDCPEELKEELLKLGSRIIRMGGMFLSSDVKDGKIQFSFWSPDF